jgi:YidC/Oxa1 family membrane protein insertase
MKLNFGFGEEWKEFKKFEKLTDKERSIVFYAENEASMNHFSLLISELTEEKNFQICYVTSVKNDPIFSSKNKNVIAFYIGDGTARTKFFLTLKAKILIMDMPDLQTFHIKRSKVYAVHYVYIFHSMFSTHSYLRKGALDNYDTIFCVGKHHEKEIRAAEERYGLKEKNLIKYGFGRLDTLLQEKQIFQKTDVKDRNLVLITPTYGEKNLLQICGKELIEILLKADFTVMLRPHYRIFKDSKKLINSMIEDFGNNPNFILEKGIIPSDKFHNSKCLISDWSGISLEYAFTFERPVILIDIPKKILNPDSGDISIEPIEVSIRDKIGHVISPNNLEKIPEIVKNIKNDSSMNEQIRKICSETVYNIGKSAKIGTEVIEKIYEESKKQDS